MKKTIIILIILFLLLLLALFLLAVYLLPGLQPVLRPPQEDIADLIDQANQGPQTGQDGEAAENNTDLPLILQKNFGISVFARDLGKVRALIDNPGGGLIASLMNKGEVAVFPDVDDDNTADRKITLLSDLYNPHGLLVDCASATDCLLYVAETGAVSRYDYDPVGYRAENREELFSLPDDGGHYTRTIIKAEVDGEDKLLTAVGSSCNVCEEEDWRRAAVLVSDMDGSGLEAFASGLRNTVFMAEHPVSGKIWGTDMGRDWLGDNLPPEEINIIEPGNDYGWPLCYGKNIHDTDFDKNQYVRDPCADKTSAHITFQAHSAPLGLDFIPASGAWPRDYHYDAIVAYHGSWNRSQPTGYKLVRFKLDRDGNLLGQEDFISGWLTADGDALGRPVAVLVRDNGEMFVSDDKAGVIYRIYYSEGQEGKNREPISLSSPEDINGHISNSLTVTGQAPGSWFADSFFPVYVLDDRGKRLAMAAARAQGIWSADSTVDFSVDLEFPVSPTETGSLVFTSSAGDDSYSRPVRFRRTTEGAGEDCASDNDCLLPPDYAIRSICPYEAQCINNRCTVVCPDF